MTLLEYFCLALGLVVLSVATSEHERLFTYMGF